MIAGEIRRSGSRAAPVLTADAALELDGSGDQLAGYASVFDRPYRVSDGLGDYVELVRPGAFAESLRARSPIVQFSHGHDPAVGSAPIAELIHAAEDSTGLYFRARLFDVPQLDLVREGLRSGAISGASFRFTVPAGGDRWRGTTTREVLRADVVELGPVVWPASPHATVTLRQRLRRLTGTSTSSTTPTGTTVLSARARAALDVLSAGASRWNDLPPAVRTELVAVAPRRVAAATIAARPRR